MEQYSDLNVHGKITQKAAQGTNSDDVVKYPTLTTRVPAQIPSPDEPGKAIIVNPDGDGFTLGEAGKVDEVQINGVTIAPTVDPGTGEITSKVANIPLATSSSVGVVQAGENVNISNGTISVNTATTGQKGVMQVGNTLEVSSGTVNQKSGVVTAGAGITVGTTEVGSATETPKIKVDTYGRVIGIDKATIQPDWNNVQNKPSTYPASPHIHGNITNDGKIGNLPNLPVITGTDGLLTAGSVSSPIEVSNGTIRHATSGPGGAGNAVDDVSKTVAITVDAYGHTTVLTGKSIQIAESQVTNLPTHLNDKVDKVTHTSGTYLYANDTGQTQIAVSQGAAAYNVVRRDASGQITVPETPTANTHATSKKYVDDQVLLNSADFLGTLDVETDLQLPETATHAQVETALGQHTWSPTPTKNDYVYVQFDLSSDPGVIDRYERYQYTGSAWEFTLEIQNPSFSSTQWGTINSGMTAADKTKLDGIEEGAQVNTVTGVKGSSESTYRTGNINITKANIGLGNVENTALSTKVVASTGSGIKPIYINASGVTTASSSSVGDANEPIYMENGEFKKVGSIDVALIAAASTTANGLMSSADKTKLNGIAAGAEVNVNADWNATSGDAVILNKPTAGTGLIIDANNAINHNTDVVADTTSTPAQLAHSGTFTAITSVTRNETGHVEKINLATYTLPASGNTDTKVTEAYSTSASSYPLLMTATAGITSTASRGATTSILNNQIYGVPSTGELHATKLFGAWDSLVISDVTLTDLTEE